jgi:acetyl esterase
VETIFKNGVGEHKEYSSPAQAESFEKLHPAYIEVAEFDCLRDEGVAFANFLKSGGVEVELFQSSGTVHGYEFAKNSEVVQKNVEKRIDSLKRHMK